MKILIIDNGLALSIALELASREDVELFYFSEWNEAFPKVESSLVGYGFERFGINLVEDFYALLKSIPDDERDDWLVLITDVGFGDLPSWLRDDGWSVFGPGSEGQKLENDRAYGKEFMLKSGIDVASYYKFETLSEVEDALTALIESPKRYVLKVDAVSGTIDTETGTASELLESISDIDDTQKGLNLGYILEEYVPGIEVAVTSFYNGTKFLKPFIGNFESEWGGYLFFADDSECPIFGMGLKGCEKNLERIAYKGVIDLNGIFVRKNAWAEGLPENNRYVGIEWTSRYGFPWGRIYTKMIENLPEVIDACAKGEEIEIQLIKSHAYFINAFANLDFEDMKDFISIGKIYAYERDNPDKYGIGFDKVIMGDDGNVSVLPGYPRMFQMIGFGNNYFEAVKNCLELYELCSEEVMFVDKKDELIPDIRDRIIFLESWV